jgi:hypothetical protein
LFRRRRAARSSPEAFGHRQPPSTKSVPNSKQSDPPRATPIAGTPTFDDVTEYVEDFYEAVLTFLAFHPNHADIAARFARAVADHATPVGSGTVARTKRIPVERRAEAAVVAWMRHQTTAYESMKIPRIKGKRREVRRMLAQRSQELLGWCRRGRGSRGGVSAQEGVDWREIIDCQP